MTTISTASKQRAGSRKLALARIREILTKYRQEGAAASACMDEIDKAMRAVK